MNDPDVLFSDNPLWNLIADSHSFKALRRSTIKVMLTEIEHKNLTITTKLDDGEIDQQTANLRRRHLDEQASVLHDKLNEIDEEHPLVAQEDV